MVDVGRDAQGEAGGTERPSKRRRGKETAERRGKPTGATTEEKEPAPAIASELRALLDLCDRVLPQESYWAKSSGSKELPDVVSLLEISEAYRAHLRKYEVTEADALPLPPNMMRRTTGQHGQGTSGCRHNTGYFVGPAAELTAMQQVLSESVGTTITADGISAMVARVAARSAEWKQKFVEAAPTEQDCMETLKRLGFRKTVPAVLSPNVEGDEWASLSAAPTRVAPEQPATQESIHDNSSAGRVATIEHIERICSAWKTPVWNTVGELFDLFEKASLAVVGSDPEPPIRLWAKVRGLNALRSRLNTLGLQYINLTEMVRKEMREAQILRMVAIQNVDQLRKKPKKMKTGGGNPIGNSKEEWTIKDISRRPDGTTSHKTDAYFEKAKKLAEDAVRANDTRGARSASTSDAASQ